MEKLSPLRMIRCFQKLCRLRISCANFSYALLAHEETFGKLKEESDRLQEEILQFKKEALQMRDDEISYQSMIAEKFRDDFTNFWEFVQAEMNENKNEEFAMDREVNKLTNEIKVLQNLIEQADLKVKLLEKEMGIRTFQI